MRTKHTFSFSQALRAIVLSTLLSLTVLSLTANAASAADNDTKHEGTMSPDQMHVLLERLDPEVERDGGRWQATINDVPIIIVTDQAHNRMRILVAIRKADNLTPDDLRRLMQANFDSALDVRYALAQNILWSTFIHPLSALHDRQFLTAIGQTINLAQTYGSSYSSGLLLFGGGDSGAIQQRELIDKLLQQGQPT
ncbi:MAG: hypothetical protein COA62_05610 [Rhodobiaceae bacterium]|nr:MAG: hypothetical protein COA62_05610 [Rhodobiaceae bacterium]